MRKVVTIIGILSISFSVFASNSNILCGTKHTSECKFSSDSITKGEDGAYVIENPRIDGLRLAGDSQTVTVYCRITVNSFPLTVFGRAWRVDREISNAKEFIAYVGSDVNKVRAWHSTDRREQITTNRIYCYK